MPPGVINRRGKINGEGEGVGSWWRQRLLPQSRVPVRAGRVLIDSAVSLSSMPGEISVLAFSGQQLTSSPGQWLVLSVFYGPTPNHTVLRPAAWSPHPAARSCSRLQGPTPHRVVLHQRMRWCSPLHQTTSSCSPLCSPESHCTVVQPTDLSCTPLHGSAPHCLVLHPAACAFYFTASIYYPLPGALALVAEWATLVPARGFSSGAVASPRAILLLIPLSP